MVLLTCLELLEGFVRNGSGQLLNALLPHNYGMRLRKSQQFRSIYATGMAINFSKTLFRILFVTDEPIEVEVADEKNPTGSVIHEPHCQVEVTMSRSAAEWLQKTLEVQLKETEAKTQ